MRPPVFDASALIALHEGYAPVFSILKQADFSRSTIAIPATALGAANTTIHYTQSAWQSTLLIGAFKVRPLTERIAIEVGPWPGDLATRHTAYETFLLGGTVVTCDPDLYKGYEIPKLAV